MTCMTVEETMKKGNQKKISKRETNSNKNKKCNTELNTLSPFNYIIKLTISKIK